MRAAILAFVNLLPYNGSHKGVRYKERQERVYLGDETAWAFIHTAHQQHDKCNAGERSSVENRSAHVGKKTRNLMQRRGLLTPNKESNLSSAPAGSFALSQTKTRPAQVEQKIANHATRIPNTKQHQGLTPIQRWKSHLSVAHDLIQALANFFQMNFLGRGGTTGEDSDRNQLNDIDYN